MKENNIGNAENKMKPNKIGFITKASSEYCDKFPIRAAIQAIPGLGSLLDTMLAGLGAKWQYERLEDFVSKLNEKLSRLEQLGRLGSVEPSEAWFDFMTQTFDRVIRTRSEEKRKRFANLVANQVFNQRDWDEAETACRLIADLSDIHIKILDIVIKAPSHEVFGGRGAITVEDKSAIKAFFKDKVIYLQDLLPDLTDIYIRMVCIELLSESLLSDVGKKYAGTLGQEIYSATGLAQWLMVWISESGNKNKADIG